MPQSLPAAATNASAARMSCVKIADDSPWRTPLFERDRLVERVEGNHVEDRREGLALHAAASRCRAPAMIVGSTQ